MNKTLFLAVPLAMLFAMPVVAEAFRPTTLRAYGGQPYAPITSPYTATLLLREGGKDAQGRRVLAYRVELNSSSCHSTLEGKAAFLSKTRELEVDSAFLPDGDVVKTSVFSGRGTDGDVTITLDVESKAPRYAGVEIRHARIIDGGCIGTEDAGFDFF
ncbi:MAG TPA: hypothetical protein VGM85_13035 [Paraburkholderia sp.]|jgi:hypothetical protein